MNVRIRNLILTLLMCNFSVFSQLFAAEPADLNISQANPLPISVMKNSDSVADARFANNDISIMPFKIAIPDAALADLQQRLANTRLPDQIPGTSWEYGTDRTYLAELLDYWQNDFDWREEERQLNQFDQFKTSGDAFHVIAPSLPGFGFSGIPAERGYSPEKMAHTLAALMQKLGYEKYAIAGGDWGAIINRYLAFNYPDRLIGLHSNMILADAPADETRRNDVSVKENAARTARAAYMRNEIAYQQIQGTKPQSLGYGLNDSPAGVAAWIVEKFHGWSDLPQGAEGDLDDNFTKDELLTNISIYWFTQTITSSTRIYYESGQGQEANPIGYINVPTGAAVFPAEIFVTPRAWAAAAYDLRHWTVMPAGGHFAALEQPQLYLQDLREFFRLLR